MATVFCTQCGQQNPDDIANMIRKWGTTLDRDPYYNPNLTKDHIDCRPA